MKKILCTLFAVSVSFSAFSQHFTVTPQGAATMQLTGYQSTPSLTSFSADGTPTAPVATTTGRPLLRLAARGYSGTAFSAVPVAQIDFQAAESFTSSSQSTRIIFSTTNVGAIFPSERMRIQGDGKVLIGLTTPILTDATLQVIGNSFDNAIYGQSNNSTGVFGKTLVGAGVEGRSTNGFGVVGEATGTGIGVRALAVSGTALEIQGSIKVGPNSPAAFEVATGTDVPSLVIPTTSLANAATDLIFITRRSNDGTGTSVSYFVHWNGSGWLIRRENNATIVAGSRFNVLVIKQ